MSKLYGEAGIIVDPHETKEIAMIPSGGADAGITFYHPML